MDEIVSSEGKNNNEITEAGNQAEEKEISAGSIKTFHAKRQFMTALTWLGCIVLIFLCFIETKIAAMGVLVPLLLLMAVGAFRDARNSEVVVSGNEISVKDYSSLGKKEYSLNPSGMVDIKIDETNEGKHRMIHNIVINSNGTAYVLPDVDDKYELLNALKSLKPGIQVKNL